MQNKHNCFKINILKEHLNSSDPKSYQKKERKIRKIAIKRFYEKSLYIFAP